MYIAYMASGRRGRKIIYEIAVGGELVADPVFKHLKTISCKYHVFRYDDVSICGFLYFQHAKTLDAAQKTIHLKSIVKFYEKSPRDICEVYKITERFWETGSIPLQGRRAVDDENACLMEHTMALVSQNKEIVERNSSLCEYLAKQNMMLMEENAKLKGPSISIQQQNNIVENKTFNIQVFLQKECQSAQSLNDFVKSIKIEEDDLMYAKECGFAQAITRIFEKELSKCAIQERPLHCTDIKRETMHIKNDDGWVKENGSNSVSMKKAISAISNKKMNRLCEFLKDHPEYNDVRSPKYNEYLHFMRSAIGGVEKDEDRSEKTVIRNIAKTVFLQR